VKYDRGAGNDRKPSACRAGDGKKVAWLVKKTDRGNEDG
jgi:hypothetical protein